MDVGDSNIIRREKQPLHFGTSKGELVPHNPAHEECKVIRSIDELSEDVMYLRMYDPRSMDIIKAGGIEYRVDSKPQVQQLLAFPEIEDDARHAYFFASGYSRHVFPHKRFDLAELGVIPYSNGLWESHNYLVEWKKPE